MEDIVAVLKKENGHANKNRNWLNICIHNSPIDIFSGMLFKIA